MFATSLLDKAKLLEKYLVIDRQNAEFPHTRRAAGIAAILAHQLHSALKAAPVQQDAPAPSGPDPLRELHDLLYMAQRIEGEQRDKAIGRARVIVHHLRDSAQSCLTPEHLKGAAISGQKPAEGETV